MRTMLLHLGQARICPMADLSRTFKRAWQVVQDTENSSTLIAYVVLDPVCSHAAAIGLAALAIRRVTVSSGGES